jgi:glyoxylase-like metal-dependent hydrolase (beta-lactamase superfamily II)
MAKGPAINPAKGYLVQEIRDHLYWVTDGSYNTMFLVTDKGVIVVDAPPTIGKNYLKAISEVTNKPINYVIYSHAHLDHIGAANMFPKNATFIAQEDILPNSTSHINDILNTSSGCLFCILMNI